MVETAPHVSSFLQTDMEAPVACSTQCGTSIVLSQRSPSKETPNEDAAAVISPCQETTVLVVADGMGGGVAGERASGLAISSVIAALRDYHTGNENLLRTAIINGMETANQEVCRLGLGAGTTLAVVEISGNQMRPYHVGDSLILLVGNRGKIKLQTVSHSPVGYAIEAGLLDETSAMHHKDRHLISNVVGSPDMRIEVGPSLKMAPRDTLLIASDGLTDNLHVEEIAEGIRKGDLLAVTQELTTRARQRMLAGGDGQPCKPDDLTVVTFRMRA